ncbi:MAG: flagellar type III secretion system pore protein FliP [Nitrospirae bacterium]|nr:flagellar type III secretion system pore protein FliP [Nitrospirota bacterium]
MEAPRNETRKARPARIVTWAGGLLLLIVPAVVWAQAIPIPKITFGIDAAREPQEVALSLQVLILMTVLSLAPSILAMLTSFTRIMIVLLFLRQALGTQQMPPNQVLGGLALFLAFFTMGPVWDKINEHALQPYLNKEITLVEAYDETMGPLREFMFSQTREKDIALFINVSRGERPRTKEDVPNSVLIPAFIISELKTAFQIGFLIYMPFIVIDMVVSAILLSMGMMFLPPVLVSMPFKLMLFVLVDGWNLVITSLVKGLRV